MIALAMRMRVSPATLLSEDDAVLATILDIYNESDERE